MVHDMNSNFCCEHSARPWLDAEKLIECVLKHDILYVSTAKSYKDNNKKETAWKQVGNELFLNDEQGG